MKKILLAVAGLAIAALATAQLAKYKDWAKSPEAYFLSPEERVEWSKVTSDTDAEKFIASYWAKRGGDAFRQEVARRIAAADEQFKMRRQRGAESARGRLFIVLGSPSRVSQSRSSVDGNSTPDTGLGGGGGARPGDAFNSSSPGAVLETWVYGKEKFDPSLGIGELRANIVVDTPKGADELRKDPAVERAIAKMTEKLASNPAPAVAATGVAPTAPTVPAVAGTGPAASAAAAPPAPAAGLPAATRAVLEPLLKEKKETAPYWGGVFRANAAGEPVYAFEFYLSGDKIPAGPVKLAGLVTSESGGEVASFFEDAVPSDMKTGTRQDRVYARAVPLPAGSYKAVFALFPPDGTAPLQSASVAFQLPVKSAEFEVSPLILTNELKPQTKLPAATDPFVFGTDRPIQVPPKGDRTFSKQDSLWYFYAVSNPKLPEAAAAPAPASTPAPGTAPAAAAPAPAAKPRIMQRIGVLRDGKPAFAPFSGTAEMQPVGPTAYASGSEIPLATFEPGYYTFTINVRDLSAPRDSAANKGYDRQAEFIVLKPDGSLPDKAAAKAPAAAPTPRPKAKTS